MTHAKYSVDPNDPRAPSQEIWDQMTDEERLRTCDALPSEIPRATPPEGDRHRIPKERAVEALGEFFRRIGRRVYLSSELPVYYPGERIFAPDVIAVLDVSPHLRERWTVSHEGKGLDLAIEVNVSGARTKDLEENVRRYARLGIPEYFILEPKKARLHGHRLDDERRAYVPIVPQHGRWPSRVLGLDLSIEDGRFRFYYGSAPLLEAAELVGRLENMVEELVHKKEEAEARVGDAEARAGEAEARAARLMARLRALGVDPDDDA